MGCLPYLQTDDTSQSTIKCPLVLLEDAQKIPLFNIPKLHFEKGFETQSF